LRLAVIVVVVAVAVVVEYFLISQEILPADDFFVFKQNNFLKYSVLEM